VGEKRVEEHKQKSGTCNDASPSVTIEGPREGKEGKKKSTREGQEEIPPEGLGPPEVTLVLHYVKPQNLALWPHPPLPE